MTMTTDTIKTCWACEGTGTDWGDTCSVCGGTGHTEEGLPVPAAQVEFERALPDRPAGSTPGSRRADDGGPPPVHWTKHNDAWAVAGPPELVKPGATVQVTSKAGNTKTVELGKLVVTANKYGDAVCLTAEADKPLTEYRWRKDGNDWWVLGPQATVGDTITITKADGSTAEAVVQHELGQRGRGFGFLVRRPEPKHIALADHAGVYATEDGTPIKVAPTRSTGQLVAKLWNEEDGRWDYLGKRGLTQVARHLTAEEAKRYGHAMEKCVFCGRRLEVEASLTAGYGPDCAAKYELPWGEED